MLYLEVKIKYNYACTDFFFQNSDHRDIMNLVNAYEYFWVDTLYMQHLFDLFDRNCKYPKKSLLDDVDRVNGFPEEHIAFFVVWSINQND